MSLKDSEETAAAVASPDPLEEHIAGMLAELGEDIERDGLQKTPLRVARSMRYLTSGYHEDARAVIASAIFEQPYDEMILVKDIEVFSLCEHHLLPFFGKAHVAYIPRGKIVGLSKIARVVDIFARRLQVQERLTVQIAETIEETLQPLGVGVIIEASHMCMTMRGVQKQHSRTCTSAMLGDFRDDSKTRAEFMRLIG